MLLSPIIAEELAQPYCPSKCRPLQLEWKTGIPKFHLEIMAFNLHNVSWWVYCLYTYSLFVLSFLYSLSTLSLYLTSLSILSNIKYGTIHLGHSQLGDQISLKFVNRRGRGQKLLKICGRPKWISNILMFHSFIHETNLPLFLLCSNFITTKDILRFIFRLRASAGSLISL